MAPFARRMLTYLAARHFLGGEKKKREMKGFRAEADFHVNATHLLPEATRVSHFMRHHRKQVQPLQR